MTYQSGTLPSLRVGFAVFLVVLALPTPAWAQPATDPGLAHQVPIPQTPGNNHSSVPDDVVNWNDALYFTASHPRTGRELWRWDGEGDAFLLVDICPGVEDAGIQELTVFENRLYFLAEDGCSKDPYALWASDGTPKGTTRVLAGISPGRLMATDSHLYYLASGVINVVQGSEIVRLATFATQEIAVGNLLFFAKDHEDLGFEPWVTDGTIEGTRIVRDLAPGAADAFHRLDRRDFFAYEDKVYFVARSGFSCAFWGSDGSEDGTRMLASLPAGHCEQGTNTTVAAFNNGFYLVTQAGDGYQILFTNGSPIGTYTVGPISSRQEMRPAATPHGVFFKVANDSGWELWWTTGKSAQRLRGGLTYGSAPVALDTNAILFTENNNELWVSDGTSGGTRDLHPPPHGHHWDALPG